MRFYLAIDLIMGHRYSRNVIVSHYIIIKIELSAIPHSHICIICYNLIMKPLIETNPYLINKAHRETSNERSARTSCGVEGIKVVDFSKVYVQIDTYRTQEVLNKIKYRLNRD